MSRIKELLKIKSQLNKEYFRLNSQLSQENLFQLIE